MHYSRSTSVTAISGLLLSTVAAGCKSRNFNSNSDVQSLNAPEKLAGTQTFRSPNGISEKCIVLPKMPRGKYSSGDIQDENNYCGLNFYEETAGLCPKTWSTSPGTIVYKIDPAKISQAKFEEKYCSDQKSDQPYIIEKVGTFKQTMNGSNTSGTFSTSSLLYYHFSRYFHASVNVPVSVYREMDKDEHFRRVTKKGQALTGSGMIGGGWDALSDAEKSPNSYSPVFELFTQGKDKIYGVIVRSKGERYGTEINGIRSDWGVGDNEDFQRTPAYEALKNTAGIKEAIDKTLKTYESSVIPALRERSNNSEVQSDIDTLASLVAKITPKQLAYWMKELSEIVIFDYIFSQQDRIGNIDFVWKWTYLDPATGDVKDRTVKEDNFKNLPRSKISSIPVPSDLASMKPVLLQRTQLGDNDAGGRVEYANFAKSTKMLQQIRHISPTTFNSLIALNNDLQSKGEIYKYITTNFPLSDEGQIPQIVSNTALAAGIVKGLCEAGKLKFDLRPDAFFATGDVVDAAIKCDGSSQIADSSSSK